MSDEPPFRDDQVELHVPRHADARAIVDCEDAPIRWAWGIRRPTTLAEARERVRIARQLHATGQGDWRYTVREAGAGRLIGWLRVHRCGAIGAKPGGWGSAAATAAAAQEGAEAEVWICPSHRERRLAERVLGLACRFAFDQVGVPWVRAEVRPDNAASLRLAQRVGFVPTGRSGPWKKDPAVTVDELWLTAVRWRALQAR